jgi:hypothetical protein
MADRAATFLTMDFCADAIYQASSSIEPGSSVASLVHQLAILHFMISPGLQDLWSGRFVEEWEDDYGCYQEGYAKDDEGYGFFEVGHG